MCITEIHILSKFFAPAFEYFIAEPFWLAHVALCVFYTNPGINLFSRGGRLPPEIHFQAQVELPWKLLQTRILDFCWKSSCAQNNQTKREKRKNSVEEQNNREDISRASICEGRVVSEWVRWRKASCLYADLAPRVTIEVQFWNIANVLFYCIVELRIKKGLASHC